MLINHLDLILSFVFWLVKMHKILGILGGMGPLATAEFMKKVISLTPAKTDQEHIPMLIRNIPQVPDRTRYIMTGGDDPFEQLKQGFQALHQAGANCIVIPCNTAHYWYDKLTQGNNIYTISIIDSVVSKIYELGYKNVGILATNATIKAKLYQSALETKGINILIPNEKEQKDVMDGIIEVKSGNVEFGTMLIEPVFNALIARHADAVILGCTEIPIALASLENENPDKCLDSLDILAQQCVYWAKGFLNQ